MTDIVLLSIDKKELHKEIMRKYSNKRYCTDTEYRNKQVTTMRQRYKRVTTNCCKCNLRIKTELLINGCCSLCCTSKA